MIIMRIPEMGKILPDGWGSVIYMCIIIYGNYSCQGEKY